MNSLTSLSVYETMGDISARMVEAAREADWDRLVSLEREVAQLRSRLVFDDRVAPLSESERQRKIELIKRILADDREVRSYTEPWMDQVRVFLGTGGRGRDMRNAYGTGGR